MQGDGQGDVEKKDHQLYRRPYVMGKARGKEEEDCIEHIEMSTLLNLRTYFRPT